jgi:hypothetical protein
MTNIVSSNGASSVAVESVVEAKAIQSMLGKYGITVAVESKIRLEK